MNREMLRGRGGGESQLAVFPPTSNLVKGMGAEQQIHLQQEIRLGDYLSFYLVPAPNRIGTIQLEERKWSSNKT